MEYCFDKGIPHSVFLGREISPGDSYWLESDQDKVLAYAAYKSEICPRCGTRESDWVGEDGKLLANPPFYFDTIQCHGCVDKEQAMSEVPSSRVGVSPVLKVNS